MTTQQSMQIQADMKSMTVGATKIINGISVTRWSEGTFETGTFGRSTMPFTAAFEIVVSQQSVALDLTGAYYLRLEAEGVKSSTVRVQYVDQAQAVFNDFRDHGDYGFSFGGSQMGRKCGQITDSTGRVVATIVYNGRVKMPDGTFMDGMGHEEWMKFCSEGKELHLDLAGR